MVSVYVHVCYIYTAIKHFYILFYSVLFYHQLIRVCICVPSLHHSVGSAPCVYFNTLRPRQNGRHFPDDILKRIFLNGNIWIPIEISLKFVPKGPINNIPALVQIMAWRRPSDKSLSEPMMVTLPTHICVTQPQWVNSLWSSDTIWRHRHGTTWDWVMACFLTTPSHYLNQCRLLIS